MGAGMDSTNKNSRLASFILILSIILANLRATIFIFLTPDTSKLLGMAWIEIFLWVGASIGVIYLLWHEKQWAGYLALWRKNWVPGLFILLALVSMLWSVEPVATSFRVLELTFAALVASYYGMRLDAERMMRVLFWFGAILFILSIGLAIGAPPTGTMPWAPFYGAWRGMYWHRNHLASITAFLSVVYLMRVLLAIKNRNSKGILDGFFYNLSLVILFYSKSATGYIVFLILHAFLLVILAWLWLYPHLQRKHYLWILAGGIVITILILMNLNFIFGVFNRDTTMTGRIGLWSNLLAMGSQRLWLGHGFGAVWTMDSFREQIRLLVGWTSQPLIGDNGFLDIYLHLGVTGVFLFIGILALVAYRTIRYAITQKTLTGFFPLLVLIYAVFANITFSLFIETEVFVWFLIVAALFMSTSVEKARVE